MTYLDGVDPAKVERDLAIVAESPRYADLRSYAGGDQRFALYLALVDGRAKRSLGVGILDLADWTWRDAYDDGMTPAEALMAAAEADDLPFADLL